MLVIRGEEAVEQCEHISLGELPVDRSTGPATPLVLGELLLGDLAQPVTVLLAPRLLGRRRPLLDHLEQELLECLVHAAAAIQR